MGEKGEVREAEREREVRENRNSSVENLKEKNNFSHFARRVGRERESESKEIKGIKSK